MQYQIQGQPYPVAVLTLQPEESVLCQKGAMSWMTHNMEMATKGGGLGKMFSRALTGEAMFQNQYTAKGGTGMIAFSSALPGEIMPVAITPERPIVAQKSAFLASEAGVSFELYFQKKIAGGFFGGEGFIMQKLSGQGIGYGFQRASFTFPEGQPRFREPGVRLSQFVLEGGTVVSAAGGEVFPSLQLVELAL